MIDENKCVFSSEVAAANGELLLAKKDLLLAAVRYGCTGMYYLSTWLEPLGGLQLVGSVEPPPHLAPTPTARLLSCTGYDLSSVRLADNQLVKEQAAPTPSATAPAVWDLVLADMAARDAEGRRKYGTPLQPGNGRDALVDAYQEALDLVVYLRQAIYERSRQ